MARPASHRPFAAFALIMTLGVTALAVRAQPAPAPAAPDEKPADATGPVTYYQASCARCHGNYGTQYTAHLRQISDTEMAGAVEDMARGPAQKPLEGKPLEEQIDLHRALQKGVPFVWIAPRETGIIRGEVLPDSTITIELDGVPTAVKPDGHTFSLDPAGKKVGAIVVKRNDKETKVEPPTKP